MNKHRNNSIFVFLLFLFVPTIAYGNMGTPLIWTGVFHLYLGNLFIGYFEGRLLSKFYGTPKIKSIWTMILANYFSALAGLIFIIALIINAPAIKLQYSILFLWIMILIAYVITIFFEFPFVAFLFRGDPAWKKKTIKSSLLTQSCSYLILFGCYLFLSETSLLTKTEIINISKMSLPKNVYVYFISNKNGDVYEGSLLNQKWHKIFDLNSTHENDRLFIRQSNSNKGEWNLVACLMTDLSHTMKYVTVKKQFASIAAPAWRSMNSKRFKYMGSSLNYGPVPKLGPAQSSTWKFSTGHWSLEGLTGTDSKTGKNVSLSLETPFASWNIRNATHLPTDKIIFQLGTDKICIYDPNKNQVSQLMLGRGPVAVVNDMNFNESTPQSPS